MDNGGRFFTIGHSNHDFGHFVHLLQGAGITAVADVRSHPFSHRLPQFNRPELEYRLTQLDIAYAFLGHWLGGRPRQSSLYDAEGRVDYERVHATDAFRQGVAELCRAAGQHRVALLCAEEDPLDCHRGLMIAPALVAWGHTLAHLRANGQVETMLEMEDRLLAATGVGAGMVDGLFAALVSAEERRVYLAQAYRIQAGRKAFRLKSDGFGEADNPMDPDSN
jgi:uncharacterized protein (DUF488 family)